MFSNVSRNNILTVSIGLILVFSIGLYLGDFFTPEETASQVVNIYSSRHYGLMEPAFALFEEETGIEVRFTYGSDAELRERLKAEGEHTPADVLITVDAGNLWLATEEGLLQSIESSLIEQNIPDHLQDPENRWFALSLRARTIVYSKERISPEELSTYEALGDPIWTDRLVLRPSTKVYTLSLVASLIAEHGETQAENIVKSWVENNPLYIDSDTRSIEAIAAGERDVGVINTYYLARKLNEDPDFPVGLFWARARARSPGLNI